MRIVILLGKKGQRIVKCRNDCVMKCTLVYQMVTEAIHDGVEIT